MHMTGVTRKGALGHFQIIDQVLTLSITFVPIIQHVASLQTLAACVVLRSQRIFLALASTNLYDLVDLDL